MVGRRRKDMKKGDKVNFLTFISELNKNLKSSDKDYRKGIFLCDCGNLCKKLIPSVRGGFSKSCGCYTGIVNPGVDMVGKRYGRLTVVSNSKFSRKYRRRDGGVDYIRTVWCNCSCGNQVTFLKDAKELRAGKYISCGCISEGISREKYTGDRFRIAYCWRSMISRVTERFEKGETCRIFEGWLCMDTFIDWSLKNGYKRGLNFCRNGDRGDYVPWNSRWDTNIRNIQEASGKSYKVIKPSGEEFLTRSLPTFCKNHNIKYSKLYSLYRLGNKELTKAGWRIERLDYQLPFTNEYLNA